MKLERCKVCTRWVDVESNEQSEAANWVSVHQDPCMHVFLAAMKPINTDVNWSLGDGIEELADYASNTYMFDYELSLPYFHWLLELFFYLKRRPEVLKELSETYSSKRKKYNEEKENVQQDKANDKII
ncbi:MAG: hypothetical protein WC346_05295 [Methanogenium sp.]|jgi:hypothetical protein